MQCSALRNAVNLHNAELRCAVGITCNDLLSVFSTTSQCGLMISIIHLDLADFQLNILARVAQRKGSRLRSGISISESTAMKAVIAKYTAGAVDSSVVAVRAVAIIGVRPPNTPNPRLNARE